MKWRVLDFLDPPKVKVGELILNHPDGLCRTGRRSTATPQLASAHRRSRLRSFGRLLRMPVGQLRGEVCRPPPPREEAPRGRTQEKGWRGASRPTPQAPPGRAKYGRPGRGGEGEESVGLPGVAAALCKRGRHQERERTNLQRYLQPFLTKPRRRIDDKNNEPDEPNESPLSILFHKQQKRGNP